LRMPLYLAWMRVFFPLGWVVSHAILIVIYYAVLTPIGLVLRLVGYDPMRRRFDRGASTYWAEHRSDDDLSQYFRRY
ncbi:MAG TPA: SxtJ family membrane protein, partial [Candidatus Krumholzibacteria bacterium]|nr:SxtJ family membrane protein [Candidatus Krumholzibacteria bacterium]